MRHFDRVLQDILAVRGAEFKPTQKHRKSRIDVENSDFKRSLLAGILDHFFKGDSRYLPSDGIKARYYYRSGRIVHNHLNSGSAFKRPDIPALLADYFSFYIIRGYID